MLDIFGSLYICQVTFYGHFLVISDAVKAFPPIVPLTFSVYVCPLCTAAVFDIETIEVPEPLQDAIKLLPSYSFMETVMLFPASLTRHSQYAVSPLNERDTVALRSPPSALAYAEHVNNTRQINRIEIILFIKNLLLLQYKT